MRAVRGRGPRGRTRPRSRARAPLVRATLAAAGLALAWGAPALAADGAALYQQHCAACHQADGSGVPGAFPPLAGNPALSDLAHVRSVIASGLTGPIEVNGQTYQGAMPPFAGQLGDADIEALVGYVRTAWGNDAALAPASATTAATGSGTAATGSGTAGASGAEAAADGSPSAASGAGTAGAAAAPAGNAPPSGDPERGAALFAGRVRLQNGGTPCAACHNVVGENPLGGGSMGRDLTTVYSRMGGAAGLKGVLSAISFPVMRQAFAGKPLTQSEIDDLVAYLRVSDQRAQAAGTAPADPTRFGFNWLWLFAVLGGALLNAMLLIWWPRQREGLAERLRRTGRSWRRESIGGSRR